MLELFSYSLSVTDLVILVVVAVLIGMGKTGVAGAGMIAVPLLAIVFGGKASTGLLLPILIFADFFGVYHYHQHANWQHLRRLLPFALIGVVIGTLTGNIIDDQAFRLIMVGIIFVSLAIMIWQQHQRQPTIPTSPLFGYSIGIIGGFATMVGNLAGPIMILYLLAMQFPKNQFIGTAAWFFLVINVLKIPFHVFAWQTITVNSFLLDAILIPAIAAGAYLGIAIVKNIPENVYRWFVIVMTLIAALAMVL
ncbi:MAG: sulfite exporter TauE/SafE family protein [Arenicella sp.]|nr:sulfite exporter TauE/SafE family protein [Arenicella sp.]